MIIKREKALHVAVILTINPQRLPCSIRLRSRALTELVLFQQRPVEADDAVFDVHILQDRSFMRNISAPRLAKNSNSLGIQYLQYCEVCLEQYLSGSVGGLDKSLLLEPYNIPANAEMQIDVMKTSAMTSGGHVRRCALLLWHFGSPESESNISVSSAC